MLSASDTCLSIDRSGDCQQTGQNLRTIKEDGYPDVRKRQTTRLGELVFL